MKSPTTNEAEATQMKTAQDQQNLSLKSGGLVCRWSVVFLVAFVTSGVFIGIPEPAEAFKANNGLDARAFGVLLENVADFAKHDCDKNKGLVHNVALIEGSVPQEDPDNKAVVQSHSLILDHNGNQTYDWIKDSDGQSKRLRRKVLGSGTLVAKDLVVTAAHNFCDYKTGLYHASGTPTKPTRDQLKASAGLQVPGCERGYQVKDVHIPGGCSSLADGRNIYEADIAFVTLAEPTCADATIYEVLPMETEAHREKYLYSGEYQIEIHGVYPLSQSEVRKLSERNGFDKLSSRLGEVARVESLTASDSDLVTKIWSSFGYILPSSSFLLTDDEKLAIRGNMTENQFFHTSSTEVGASGAGVRLDAGTNALVGIHLGAVDVVKPDKKTGKSSRFKLNIGRYLTREDAEIIADLSGQ